MLALVEALQKSSIKGSAFVLAIKKMQLALQPHLHANRAVGPQRWFFHRWIGNACKFACNHPTVLLAQSQLKHSTNPVLCIMIV